MKASLSWLKAYVDIQMDTDRLADSLTMVGLEVETVYDRYGYLETVLVGRIDDVQPHPNADRLTVCTVAAGQRHYKIVCGAPNVTPGMLAPLALPGTELPAGVKIAESTIRGQHSEGMLCSAVELGLGGDASGIMELDAGLATGVSLNKALGLNDPVLEIGLTPNRSDCLSIMGIAREVAALQGQRIHRPEVKQPSAGGAIEQLTSVQILAPDHCPRYAARLLEQVQVTPSPFWLQDRLLSVGLRPINNLVDVTNFVMLETGQPLHAFDFDNLSEQRIVVRTAEDGEVFVTLDGKERRLNPETLMICDGEKPVAIGGVMGGMNSEIEESTVRVLIESAYFDPVSIRRTAKRLGLNTDASYRFERGVDPRGTIYALERAAQMMVDLAGGRLVDGYIDICYRLPEPQPVKLSVDATNRLLGTGLNKGRITDLLKSIEFKVDSLDQDTLQVIAPSYRVDISRPVDLMEEVARLEGYNSIATTFPPIASSGKAPQERLVYRDKIRHLLTGMGFSEAINYSFISEASCDRLRLGADDKRRRQLPIVNPLTEDQAVMRTSLVPGLLETVARNLARQVNHLRVFEVGKVFLSRGKDALPQEPEMLAGVMTGRRYDAPLYSRESDCDFFDMKMAVEGILCGLAITDVRFTVVSDDDCFYTQPGQSAWVLSGTEPLGLVGRVHGEVCRTYDLKQPVFLFDLDLEKLLNVIPGRRTSTAIPKFPSTARDITLIVDRDIESRLFLEYIAAMGEELIDDFYLFDVFEGKPIAAGKKSISIRIVYRSARSTLEDEQVNQLHKVVGQRLIKEFRASVPA